MTTYNQTLLKTEDIGHGFQIRYYAECLGTGCAWLQDLYTGTDEHEAGVTIKNPSYDGRNWKYYIGQYTPAELAASYAKQGRENPSAEAYKSLQDELQHYIEADDCSFYAELVRVETTGNVESIDILEDAHSCLVFDYSSPEYCGEFEEHARDVATDNGIFEELKGELMVYVRAKSAALKELEALV